MIDMTEIKRDIAFTHNWVGVLSDDALIDPRRVREIQRHLNAISRKLTIELRNNPVCKGCDELEEHHCRECLGCYDGHRGGCSLEVN